MKTKEKIMEYRAINNRCAAIISSLNLPMTDEEALAILKLKGFTIKEIDIISLARGCIGTSLYRRGARFSEAPAYLDCSLFMKWLYGQLGIWLPRRSVQQRKLGQSVELKELEAGDLIFTTGRINYYLDDPADNVGHVGIYTGENTVIKAGNKKVNIVETSLEHFVREDRFRGARRYIPKGANIIVFETPPQYEIEIVDDLRWIILQSFPG